MSKPYYAAACQMAFDCSADRSSIVDRSRRMCAIAELTMLG